MKHNLVWNHFTVWTILEKKRNLIEYDLHFKNRLTSRRFTRYKFIYSFQNKMIGDECSPHHNFFWLTTRENQNLP